MAFQLVAGHPALDFINTLDWRFGNRPHEELLASYEDLVRFARQSGLVTARPSGTESARAGVLGRSIELREALADIFYARLDQRQPSAAARRTVERYFRELRLHHRLNWTHSPHLSWEAANVPAGELPLWALVSSACDLMTSDVVERVRACNNTECRWLFLDTSKNRTRRWCDMAVCGNRMKARRFRAHNRG
jgi:predicted RNA-binding Zn ribbon-like protein